MLPALVGVLASLYLFEDNSRRIFSKIISLLLVLLNAAALVFGISVSLFSLSAIILAYFITKAYVREQSKADTAYVLTLICAVFAVLGYIILAMREQGEYTLDAVVQFYSGINGELREIFTATLTQMYQSYGIEITAETIAKIYDTQVYMLISYAIIGAFAMVGISMKLFSAIVSRCSKDNTHILKWRFITTNVYAYFYVILAMVSIFANSPDSLFGIAVLNLYNIFMAIYAYVGFNYALALICKKFRPVVSFIILAISILLLSSFAIQLLSALGVMFAVRKNNEIKMKNQ